MSLKCTTCNSTCKLVEKGYNRFFCNTSCQRKYYVNLKVEADEEGPAVDDDDIIGLESSDGFKFRVTRKECESMKTVKDLVDTITPKDTEQYITIPSITGKMLGKNIDFIRKKISRVYSFEETVEIVNSANYLNHESFILKLLKRLYKKFNDDRPPDVKTVLKMDKNILETFILIGRPNFFYNVYDGDDLKNFKKVSPNFFEKYEDFDTVSSIFIHSIAIGNILAVRYYVEIIKIGRGNDEPFLTAAQYGQVAILEILRPRWMNQNSYGKAIIRAVDANRNDAVEYLVRIEQTFPIPSEAIIHAATKGNFEIFRILQRDTRVKVYKSIPILVELGYIELLKELLDEVEKNDIDDLAHSAIRFNQYDIFFWLLDTFDMNIGYDENDNLLRYAAEHHSYKIFQELLPMVPDDSYISSIPYEFKTPELRAILARYYKKQKINGRVQ